MRRDLKSQKGWVLALVILIALSAGIYSSFRSTYDSGLASINGADEELNSADITVSTAPMDDLSTLIGDISGISMVSSAFLTDTYSFVDGERVRGEVHSVQLGERVSDYHILKGTDVESENNVVVERHYAEKHSIKPGQEITLYIKGNATDFTVSGICFSPRHIYLISPEGWIEKDFGIFYVSLGILGGFVNTYYIMLSNESRIDRALSNVKSFFVNRGINAVVMSAEKDFAYTAFKEDLGAMNSLANLFTIVLLAIFAFVLFVVLSRLVEMKRHEIGTLRAMGYSKRSIFAYFLLFSGITVILGVILSIPIGLGLLSFIMDYFAVKTLGIPVEFVAYKLDIVYVIYAAIFSIIISLVGAFFPSYRAASYTPAEAMRPYIASKKGSRIMSRSSVSPTKKLILRDIFGHRARNVGTVVVIALLLSLGLSFAISMSSIEDGVVQRFDKNELWDIKIDFNTPQNLSTLNELTSIEDIESIEPYNGYGVEVSYNNKSTIIQLNELIENTKMHSFSLAKGNSNGLIISGDVAHRLGVSVGENVVVITPLSTNDTEVSGIFQEFGSSEGYMLKNLTRSNGALIRVRSGAIRHVEQALQNLSFIQSWVRKWELREGWLYLMDEYYAMVYAMDIIIVTLMMITIGVFSFLSIREREWEFVILKAMGFSNWDLLGGSLVKTMLLSCVGVLLGIPLSLQLATQFNATFENLLSPPPTVLDPGIVIMRVILVIGVSLLTVFIVIRFALKRNVAERLRRVFEAM